MNLCKPQCAIFCFAKDNILYEGNLRDNNSDDDEDKLLGVFNDNNKNNIENENDYIS